MLVWGMQEVDNCLSAPDQEVAIVVGRGVCDRNLPGFRIEAPQFYAAVLERCTALILDMSR
jgi:hypothetical protein